MAFKSLLTHVISDRGCGARLHMVRSIAEALSARAIGLGARAPWPYADTGHGHGGQFEQLVYWAKQDVETARQAFADAFAGSASPAAWRSEIAYPNMALARHAAAADLLVAYRTSGVADLSTFAAPEMVLMEAGLPVLLMPGTERTFRAEAILLAWKNTREARRAISMSLPLLAQAKLVLVVAVCERREISHVEAELRDVTERLEAHGVRASSLAEVGAPGAAGRRLVRLAQTQGSDVIVAGGYGHSRLREWILGGVTRDLIADRRHYVLLCH
jgi:nucleotide-binding universal stress UspA family protein